MKLLQNEEIVSNSDDSSIILTTTRIYKKEKAWGHSYSIYVFLEDISSTEITYKSNIFLLILTVISILAFAVFAGMEFQELRELKQSPVLLIPISIFLLLWWLTKKHIISLTTHSGKSLTFIVTKISKERIEDFVHKLQTAKAKRLKEII